MKTLLQLQNNALPIAVTDAKLAPKLSPKTTRTQNSCESHWCACLTNARQQRCSLVQQLAEGYSSRVSWLSCYWAVNSADGSCLCVLIRSVTLNLSIDTWGDAERGKAAIYRPSIMTFIDDVTTGAQCFGTHTHTHIVRQGIESICLSFVHQNTHSNTHQAKAIP